MKIHFSFIALVLTISGLFLTGCEKDELTQKAPSNELEPPIGEMVEGRDNIIEGNGRRWDGGIIPYVIAIDPADPIYPNILTAIDIINSTTVLTLRPENGEDAYVRFIKLEAMSSSTDYINYRTFVGKVGRGQAIIADYDGNSVGSILHEIIHAAGLYDEHTRPDRDDYLKINEENIAPAAKDFFRKRSNTIYGSPTLDFNSIMMPRPDAFSRNGLPIIEPINPLPPGVTLGQRDSLSAGDIKALEFMYSSVSFNKFLLQTATALGQTHNPDDHFVFRFTDYDRDGKPDLMAIKKDGASEIGRAHV